MSLFLINIAVIALTFCVFMWSRITARQGREIDNIKRTLDRLTHPSNGFSDNDISL